PLPVLPTALPILTQVRAPGFPPRAPKPGIPRLGTGSLAVVDPPRPVLVALRPLTQLRVPGFPRRAPLPGIPQLGRGILYVDPPYGSVCSSAPQNDFSATGASLFAGDGSSAPTITGTATGASLFGAAGSSAPACTGAATGASAV